MLEQMGIAAKQASYKLAQLSSREKNRVLEKIADELEAQSEIILNANAQDVADARANGLGEAMLDRLALTPARLKGIADDVRQVCNLADPVGQVIDGSVLDSGLRLERRRVPLGVIGVIYEARPNVTVDVASLCLKTGNAVILRGGKETCRTNAATVAVIQDALKSCGLPAGAVQDHRITGFQAQRSDINRHVRARFINHANNPQRYATTLKTQAAVQYAAIDYLPHRIGEVTHLAHIIGNAFQPCGRQCQTVKHRFAKAIGTRVSNILGVSVEDDFALCFQFIGDFFQHAIFFAAGELR